MDIIFYSTHCPKCRALEMLLKNKKIQYIEENDVDHMISLGLRSAPALMVDGKIMDFPAAMEWVRGQ